MTSKHFGLAGVAADVQFGKSGPHLIQTGGVFQFKNSDVSALARAQGAEPTSPTDLTSKQFVENAVLAVQTELNSTQTGAGLASNGIFNANSSSHYLSGAVSLLDASNILDYSLYLLQAELNTSQTGAGLSTDGTYSANGTSNYISSATSLTSADNLLDYSLSLVQTELNTTQSGAGLSSTGTYSANSSGNYISSATSLKTADDLLDYNLKLVQVELDTTQSTVGLTSTGTLPAWSGVNYVGNSITVLDAIAALDVRLKTTNDTISSFGTGVFNYVGTLEGGADSGSAFDLSTLSASGKDTGDYYKVSTAGYFKGSVAGIPFYANLNDGLVKNDQANGWDVIDNTNSTIAGTSNRVTVSGSVDSGYTVDIASTYTGQTSITSLGSVSIGTWAANTITTEYGGTGLVTYAAGDILYASDSQTLARLPKGTANQFLKMNSGATSPEYATLYANAVVFSGSGFAANNANAALVELLGFRNATNTGAGLASNGTYSANATGNYISGATSLADADNRLDAAIKVIEGAVGAMASSEILSPTLNTSVKAANTVIEYYGDVSNTKTLVGTTNFGVDTNSRYQLDLSIANTVVLRANSVSANVNLVLEPQGTGVVSVSNAVVSNVADPVLAQDAVTLGFANASFLRQAILSISEDNTDLSFGTINGTITRTLVSISSPWDSGSTITVGITGNETLLVTSADIDATETAIYVVDNVAVINNEVWAYISGTGTGTGTIIIEYVPA
jgi:azurin